MNIPNKTILIDCVLCTLWSFYDVPFKVMMDDKKLSCIAAFYFVSYTLLLGTEVEEITHEVSTVDTKLESKMFLSNQQLCIYD